MTPPADLSSPAPLEPLSPDEAKKVITLFETAFGWTGELPNLDRRTFYRMAETLERGVKAGAVSMADSRGDEPTPKEVRAVLDALHSPYYLWRTVEGVADETHLSLGTVLWVFYNCRDQILKHPVGTKDGREAYAHKGHYRQNASFWRRLWATLKGKPA